MNFTIMFFVKSIMLGIGLAMDAFSVSVANGLSDTKMKTPKMTVIAGTFSFFQALMPMLGWFLVHAFITQFKVFEKFIPYIALILLSYIGGKMLYDSFKKNEEDITTSEITFSVLMVQGIATSIDALSVGFTISDYNAVMALISSLIIAVVTFIICMAGIEIGKSAGTKLADKSGVLGGVILIFIGLEIFISGVFF